jgi:hypothetical protein
MSGFGNRPDFNHFLSVRVLMSSFFESVPGRSKIGRGCGGVACGGIVDGANFI